MGGSQTYRHAGERGGEVEVRPMPAGNKSRRAAGIAHVTDVLMMLSDVAIYGTFLASTVFLSHGSLRRCYRITTREDEFQKKKKKTIVGNITASS